MVQVIGRIVLLIAIILCALAFFGAGKTDPVQFLAAAGVLGFGAILVMST